MRGITVDRWTCPTCNETIHRGLRTKRSWVKFRDREQLKHTKLHRRGILSEGPESMPR